MSRRRGFSLLEILLAMFLLSICLGLLAGTFPLVKAAERRADRLANASFLAQQAMEERLGRDPQEWPPETGSFPPPHESYSWRATLAEWPEDPHLQILRIEIRHPDVPEALYDLETLIIP